ncbi:hypothetical protein L7F22_058848 [Adiantum nelumboides]|nr:hypothetical protein [Adiantum nelumboides]
MASSLLLPLGQRWDGRGRRGRGVSRIETAWSVYVLDRAMMEHNILATSRLYTNITLQGLGSLLDLSAPGAETMARRMIAQGRLRAEIDQVDGLILFKSHATGRDAGPQTVTAGGKQAQSGSGGAAGVGGGEGESAGGTTGNDQGMLIAKALAAAVMTTTTQMQYTPSAGMQASQRRPAASRTSVPVFGPSI